MTGRDIFRIFGPLIRGLTAILRVLPRGLLESSWFLVDGLPGRFGIFLRYLYAQRLCKACRKNVLIGPRCTILNWQGLEIGENVTIHVGSYIDAIGGVTIGDDVSIAHSSSILSFEHTWHDNSVPIKYNPLHFDSVTIGPDAWIGCGVRILAGTHIGKRTIIAAGAVTAKGEYAYGLYGGVPAKLLKAIR